MAFSPKPISDEKWEAFLSAYLTDSRFAGEEFENIEVKENFLICNRTVNSYQASVIAEFFRENLLQTDQTFSFETVMSHTSKVDFLRKAKQQGFTNYLYFICTRDPAINLQRVNNRVAEGGHHVEEGKVTSRYFRSLELLSSAFVEVDRAFIIDSTNTGRDVILEKRHDEILLHQEAVPDWVVEYLLNKLKLS